MKGGKGVGGRGGEKDVTSHSWMFIGKTLFSATRISGKNQRNIQKETEKKRIKEEKRKRDTREAHGDHENEGNATEGEEDDDESIYLFFCVCFVWTWISTVCL